MRKIAKQRDQGGAEIDLTPMLDVVFIMLIFFIVVASFIKEAGVEVNRPDDNQPDNPEDSTSILVEVASDNQIWMENRRVDIRAVRANIQRLLAEDPEAPVTIKVEKGAEAGIVVDVADAARESGVAAVNWASDRSRVMV
jgi:biopolymer transport protein ExbD